MPVEGPIVLDRLRPYLDGSYASDGETLFYGWQRVMTVSPPVDATKMRQLTRDRTARPGYVTDGRWILYEHQVLDGADAASFKPVPMPPGSDKESDRYGGERGNVLATPADLAPLQVTHLLHSPRVVHLPLGQMDRCYQHDDPPAWLANESSARK
jgi:hypothetical protein